MILVTGGAGYIGSVLIDELIDRGEQVICFDNLSTGNRTAVNDAALFVRGDVRDASLVRFLFENYPVEGVIHLAANSIIDDAVANPFAHLDDNVRGATVLLKEAHRQEVDWFLFASSANGEASPYGASKLIIEKMLPWVNFRSGIFRFYNVAGATERRGEQRAVETHLIPKLLDVVNGAFPELYVYGNDYDTPDGSAIRDYVHVSDVTQAHMMAIKHFRGDGDRFRVELGAGRGYSVLEIIQAARRLWPHRHITYGLQPRRPGDPARLVAAVREAKAILGWSTTRSLDDILLSAQAFRETLCHSPAYLLGAI